MAGKRVSELSQLPDLSSAPRVLVQTATGVKQAAIDSGIVIGGTNDAPTLSLAVVGRIFDFASIANSGNDSSGQPIFSYGIWINRTGVQRTVTLNGYAPVGYTGMGAYAVLDSNGNQGAAVTFNLGSTTSDLATGVIVPPGSSIVTRAVSNGVRFFGSFIITS